MKNLYCNFENIMLKEQSNKCHFLFWQRNLLLSILLLKTNQPIKQQNQKSWTKYRTRPFESHGDLSRQPGCESILVFYRCCNKLPRIRCLYSAYMSYVIIPEVRSLKWSYWTKVKMLAEFLLKVLEDNLLPCLFQLLEAACTPWLMVTFAIFKASSVGSSNL